MSFCVWVDPESNEDLYSTNLFGQPIFNLMTSFFLSRDGVILCVSSCSGGFEQ